MKPTPTNTKDMPRSSRCSRFSTVCHRGSSFLTDRRSPSPFAAATAHVWTCRQSCFCPSADSYSFCADLSFCSARAISAARALSSSACAGGFGLALLQFGLEPCLLLGGLLRLDLVCAAFLASIRAWRRRPCCSARLLGGGTRFVPCGSRRPRLLSARLVLCRLLLRERLRLGICAALRAAACFSAASRSRAPASRQLSRLGGGLCSRGFPRGAPASSAAAFGAAARSHCRPASAASGLQPRGARRITTGAPDRDVAVPRRRATDAAPALRCADPAPRLGQERRLRRRLRPEVAIPRRRRRDRLLQRRHERLGMSGSFGRHAGRIRAAESSA